MEKQQFMLVVEGKHVLASDKSVMTHEGQKFVVIDEPEGWVEADSRHWNGDAHADAKKFDSPEAAAKFAKRWKGYPWWCKPNGNFEVYPLKPVYKKELSGYELGKKVAHV